MKVNVLRFNLEGMEGEGVTDIASFKRWVEYEGPGRQSGHYFTHDNKQPLKGDIVIFAWRTDKGTFTVGDAVVKEKIIDSKGVCHIFTESVRLYPGEQRMEAEGRFVKPLEAKQYGELIENAWT